MNNSTYRSGWHFVGMIFAAAFAFYMAMPLLVILIASATDAGYVQFPPADWGVRWYAEVFRNDKLMDGLVFSLQIAVSVALISGVLGISAAFAVARADFRGKEALIGFMTMPLAVPHVVLALALLQLFALMGIATSPWGLAAGHILVTLPYVLRLTLTSLHDLDQQVERASYSLGASAWTTFRLVTLPMIAPGVIAGVFFAFLLSFDEVTISIFLSQPARTTLPAEIFGIASHGSDPIITAASGILIVVATLLVLLIERQFGALRLVVGGKGK